MKEYGFQGVILAYPIEGGKYRIESGHRRRLAARKAGIENNTCFGNRTSQKQSMKERDVSLARTC